MDVIIDKGCGLDVHKETVVACVMGSGIKKEMLYCIKDGSIWLIRYAYATREQLEKSVFQ